MSVRSQKSREKLFPTLKYNVPKADLLFEFSLQPLYESVQQGDFVDYLTSFLFDWKTVKPATFNEFKNKIARLRVVAAEKPDTPADAKDFNATLPIASTPDTAIPSTDEITSQFFSPNRLKFSDQLVSRFGESPEGLARALVNALLTGGQREYRVNLYIALTLARLPNGWPQSADPQDKVGQSKKRFNDKTFQKRFQEAIDNRISP
jgi:hypothetical protein